jgi:hypothetical protein
MSFLIVTGADQKYFGLLQGLLASLGDLTRHVAVLDLGLTAGQVEDLQKQVAQVARFEYPHTYPARDQVTREFPGFGAMLARPYLNDIFPGIETLMWLDADTWVQDPSAIHDILAQARLQGVAAVPELDRAYYKYRHEGKHVWQLEYDTYLRCFGAQVAQRMSLIPVINSGVWAARTDSALWPAWKRLLQDGLSRLDKIDDETRIIEQAAFNVALESEELKVVRFPATYNWMACFAAPGWHVEKQLLADPNPPHDVIRIIHISVHFVREAIKLPLIGHHDQSVITHLGRESVVQLPKVVAALLR